MRKLTLLVGILAMGATSLQASGIAAAPPKAPPKAQKTGSAMGQDCCTYIASFNETETKTTGYIDYNGGYFGPVNMALATSGVYNGSASTTNAQGQVISATQSWSNGLTIGITHNIGQGQGAINFEFAYLTNNPNTTKTANFASTYANMVPVNATNYNTSASEQITSVNGNYGLKGMNLGKLRMYHPIYNRNNLFIFVNGNAQIGYLNHNSTVNVTLLADATQNSTVKTDKMVHGGPGAGLLMMKFLDYGFTLSAEVETSAHAANISHAATAQKTTGTTLNGYEVNTKGNIPLLFQRIEAKANLAWSHYLDNGGLLTFKTGWAGGFANSSNMLFRSASGTGSLIPQDTAWGTLNTGFAITY